MEEKPTHSCGLDKAANDINEKKGNLRFCSAANQKKKKSYFLWRRGKVFSANQKTMEAKFLALQKKSVAAAVSPKLHKFGS